MFIINAEKANKDLELIVSIVDRASDLGVVRANKMILSIDLEVAHSQFNLRLDELLKADDLNFSHDIIGIQNYIDRKAKKIVGLFVPRFAENGVGQIEEYYEAQGSNRERTISLTIGTDEGGWSLYDAIDNNMRYFYNVGIEDLSDQQLNKVVLNLLGQIDTFDQDHDVLRLDLVLGKGFKMIKEGWRTL